MDFAIKNVKDELTSCGFPWFERFEDMHEPLRTLLEDDEENNGTWGFGANPSPSRSYKTGYMALAIGNYQLAAKSLKAAIDSERFKQLDQLRIDYELALVKSI
ncbi:hypothetical protein E4K67_29300 [Desulfosporosinus fructosivorans]|uniref:Tetratricopeptide repeat protein n=1 Tax=Desulfosporosinus fructosivorans TaxID=2018669 RepID=A0A4Z0QVB4_9FIRM|nr:hypothetical protein [Desulfosporosinus fructosivorans]TGE34722.1 hypothetical protein E4K67_29300 [Desulfosporosinus fructosivorans]